MSLHFCREAFLRRVFSQDEDRVAWLGLPGAVAAESGSSSPLPVGIQGHGASLNLQVLKAEISTP